MKTVLKSRVKTPEPTRLNVLLDGLLSRLGLSYQLGGWKIGSLWPEITGDKIASENEKKQIADAARRRVERTTEYLNQKTEIKPALNISADDLKQKLKEAASRQRLNFK